MFKCFCFFIVFVFAVCALQAQASGQVSRCYRITLQPGVTIHPDSIRIYLKQVGAADSVRYNSLTKEYKLYSQRTLQKNIVGGRLEKYNAPLLYFGEEPIPETGFDPPAPAKQGE